MVSLSRLLVSQERASLSVSTFSTLFLPAFVSYFGMAVLVQRKRTAMIRFALLPVTLLCSYRAGSSLDLSFGIPDYLFLNQILVVSALYKLSVMKNLSYSSVTTQAAAFTFSMRSTGWAFAKNPYSRIALQPNKTFNGDTMSDSTSSQLINVEDTPLFTAFWNAWDLSVNLRGIGWDWPKGLRIPKSSCGTESTSKFLLSTLVKLLFNTLAFDAASRAAQYLSPERFGSTEGGTIFDASLPPLSRYTRSAIITILSGCAVYLLVESLYHIYTIVFVLLFRQAPSQWPPLFDTPWLSTSLTSFWGRRWHQLLREYFISVGARPLAYLFGRPGGVMGAFLISGALHYLVLKAMERGGHPVVVFGFFIMQAVGLILEDIWKKRTGSRVDGFWGSLWTWLWLVFWGTFMIDAWARVGLIESKFFPDDYRPTVLLVHFLKHGFNLF